MAVSFDGLLAGLDGENSVEANPCGLLLLLSTTFDDLASDQDQLTKHRDIYGFMAWVVAILVMWSQVLA